MRGLDFTGFQSAVVPVHSDRLEDGSRARMVCARSQICSKLDRCVQSNDRSRMAPATWQGFGSETELLSVPLAQAKSSRHRHWALEVFHSTGLRNICCRRQLLLQGAA